MSNAPNPAPDEIIAAGTVVRDRRWGGTHTGTVIRREDRRLFVAWHATMVEDELGIDEVTVCPDAPTQLRDWRGGLGFMDGEAYLVVALTGGEKR